MYKIKKSLGKKVISYVIMLAMAISLSAVCAFATTSTTLEKGSYMVDADMSLFVNAMGGIEFADKFELNATTYGTSGIYQSASMLVDEKGDKFLTINFGKGAGKIYTVEFESYIDPNYTIKYYNDNHELKNVTSYTLSDDKSYVASVTIPFEVDMSAKIYDKSTSSVVSAGNTADGTKVAINLWFVVNSNVMGLQFCDGSGTAGSNTFETETKYVASVLVDIDSAEKIIEPDKTSTQSANVEYIVEGGYEVEIPSAITLDAATGEGKYTITAKNFVIGENAYVTVTTDEKGVLKNGSDEIGFSNTLTSGKLTKDGDKFEGTIKIDDKPSNPGKYAGTVDFIIKYYSGK